MKNVGNSLGFYIRVHGLGLQRASGVWQIKPPFFCVQTLWSLLADGGYLAAFQAIQIKGVKS